jgi:hypothetical protein
MMIATYAVRLVLLLVTAIVGCWLGSFAGVAIAFALSLVAETTEVGWVVYVGGLFGAGAGIVAGGVLLRRTNADGD